MRIAAAWLPIPIITSSALDQLSCVVMCGGDPQERLTLKHRNSSKWARRALKRGQTAMDPTTREAINAQLALGQQLRRRIEGKRDSSDGEGGGTSDDR